MWGQRKVWGFVIYGFYDGRYWSMFVCWGKWTRTKERERLMEGKGMKHKAGGSGWGGGEGLALRGRGTWSPLWLEGNKRGFQIVSIDRFGALVVKRWGSIPWWLLISSMRHVWGSSSVGKGTWEACGDAGRQEIVFSENGTSNLLEKQKHCWSALSTSWKYTMN